MNETLNLFNRRQLPVFRQSASAECGLACLAMVAWYHGLKSDLGELRRRFVISMRGVDLLSLLEMAKEIGLGGRGVRCEVEELHKLRMPCILHMNFNHFVVLKAAKRGRFVVHDPAYGARIYSEEEIGRSFTGVAIELTPTEKFNPKDPPRRLRFFDLVKPGANFTSAITLGLVLALFAELALLASPFFMQLLIDEVLVKGDGTLLLVLCVGFGSLVLFQVVSQLMRQLTLQYLGQIVSFDMWSRLFGRMLELKADFFAQRHLGDIQHRIRSLEQVRAFLTSGAIELVTDLIFLVVIAVVMILYSVPMSFAVAGMVLVYIGWRVATFGAMKQTAGDLLVAEGAEQTHLLESLRSINSIKTGALEGIRAASWRNKMIKRANAHIRTGNIGIIEQNVTTFILEVGRIGVIAMGAMAVVAGEFSIGMLTAFTAYLGMMSMRLRSLVESFIQLKLLDVPMSRIADFAFSEVEHPGENGGRAEKLAGNIAIERVYFRYGSSEKMVLNGASLDVKAGEFVAIVGPSGAGKSTLLKLLCGLESPYSGKLSFDGRPMSSWGLSTLRRQISVVLQDDTLFQGSLAENIAGFSSDLDMDEVRAAAEKASISREIEAMPMGYETLVGDMGSSLSGGQRQRVILARAIYRKPAVVLLDEATSHLDKENESAVLRAISDLNATRIVIAHREETIAHADRVIQLEGGVLREKAAAEAIKRKLESLGLKET